MDERWHLYLLRCGDGSLYCGIAKDVAARLSQHSAGKGARYTRGRGPLDLIAKAVCRTHRLALQSELSFKRLSREQKLTVARSSRALAAFVQRVSRASISPTKS